MFDKIGYWLGVGIASLVNLLDIELVVIGGGLSATGELLLHPARLSLEEFIFSPAHRQLPEIITAHLGTEAGMVGAGILALEMAGAGAAPNVNPMPTKNPVKSPLSGHPHNGDFEEYWRFHLEREHQRLSPGDNQGQYTLGA